MPVEEEHLDVMQNIEFAIIQIYRSNAALTDYEVRSAIELLIRDYTAEARGRQPAARPLTGLTKEVADAVKGVCDWRLGRIQAEGDQGQTLEAAPITLDEIIACLKRVRKSIDLWSKQGGRQGYLEHIKRFLRR